MAEPPGGGEVPDGAGGVASAPGMPLASGSQLRPQACLPAAQVGPEAPPHAAPQQLRQRPWQTADLSPASVSPRLQPPGHQQLWDTREKMKPQESTPACHQGEQPPFPCLPLAEPPSKRTWGSGSCPPALPGQPCALRTMQPWEPAGASALCCYSPHTKGDCRQEVLLREGPREPRL